MVFLNPGPTFHCFWVYRSERDNNNWKCSIMEPEQVNGEMVSALFKCLTLYHHIISNLDPLCENVGIIL